MTADTPARVSDAKTDLPTHGELDKLFKDTTAPRVSDFSPASSKIIEELQAKIHNSRALTQAQAERIAALEADFAKLCAGWDDLHVRATAAESSLAETRAKVEVLERVAAALKKLDLYSDFSEPIGPNEPITYDDPSGINEAQAEAVNALAALSALPEAKPAAQAEGE